jgi:hypothetical protein
LEIGGKWDFEPSGNKSYTRKGWRLYAYVPDPNASEPILAQAFLAYDKNAAFSLSASIVPAVVRYMENQEAHHKEDEL